MTRRLASASLFATALALGLAAAGCGDSAIVGNCVPPRVACNDSCVDPTSDSFNCGGCGKVCDRGFLCQQSACVPACQGALVPCGSVCVNAMTDRANCGSCGVTCAPGEICSGGKCALACQDGFTSCFGVCVNLKNDPANCGACGNACKKGEVCSGGTCALSCQDVLTNCNGICRDLKTDRANCGACGNACDPGLVCSGGVCAPSCGAPFVECNGGCVDPRFDPDNCGGCGKACVFPNATPNCNNGVCGLLACLPGFGDCNNDLADGCEQTLDTLVHCGACGRPCAVAHGTPDCGMGICTIGKCDSGFVDCNLKAADGCEIDTRNDAANCGACGKACAMGQACCGGVCIAASQYIMDVNNCGACGNACPNGGTCCGGICYAMGQTPDCSDCSKPCNSQKTSGGGFGNWVTSRLNQDPNVGLTTINQGGVANVTSPIVWVVLHDSNFANRIDAQTGKVLGVYFTRGGNPSRTTVALDDTLWIAHRCPATPTDPNCSNVVQLNPDGTTGCIVSKAADGQPLPLNRAIAVDQYGYVWDGTWNDHRVHKIDPLTCKTILDVDLTSGGQTSYPYGFAIDTKGKMWVSTLDSGNWMSVDTNTGKVVDIVTKPYNSYGVVVDRNDNAYYAEWCRNGINRVDGATKAVSRIDLSGSFNANFCARGMAIDNAGDIWASIVSWNSAPGATYGLKIKGGTTQILGAWVANGVTQGVGIAGDSFGRMWMTGSTSNTVARLNAATGATELSAALIGTNAYNYSDWTGYALKTVVTRNGQFGNGLYVHDAGAAASWQKATWNANLPAGTSCRVRFRAAATVLGLQSANWCDPVNASPANLRACNFGAQRYLQAQVFLTTNNDAVQPTFNDLKVFWQ